MSVAGGSRPASAANDLDDLLGRLVRPDRPDAPALLRADGRVAFTGGALAERVRACAAAFERAGIGRGAAVAFGIRQDAAGIAWLLGAFRSGVAVVVLDPGLAPGILAERCRAAGVVATVMDGGVATIAHHGLLRRLAAWRGLALPDPRTLAAAVWATSPVLGRIPRLDRLARGDAHRPLDPGDTAIAIFTSGTTGAPRAVVHTPASLAETLRQAGALVELGPADRVLGTGLHLVGPALLAGAAVVVPPAGTDAATLARVTRATATTHVSLPLHRAIAWAGAGGASRALRHVLLGSAPVRNAGLRTLADALAGVRIESVYGMTEHLLIARVGLEERLDHDERVGDLVGTPLPGVRVRIADDGEAWVSGPALARGYLGHAAPAAGLANGDLASLDARGRLILRGRRKEMLIRGGENIYPALYEAPLADAAGIAAAVLVGIEAPDGDERVALFAVPGPGMTPAAALARLEGVLRRADAPIDRHARPDLVLAVDALPRAGRSGKPDRAALSAIAAARLGGGR